MPCFHGVVGGSLMHICGFNHCYRLPLSDGRRVFMEWHTYLGPMVYRDKYRNRAIDDWWKDQGIVDAVNWFHDRGERA